MSNFPPISRFSVLFQRKEEGYYVTIPDVPGVGAFGRTLEEAQDELRAALMNQVITLKESDGEEISPPTSFAQYLVIPTGEKGWMDRPNSWKFLQILNESHNA